MLDYVTDGRDEYRVTYTHFQTFSLAVAQVREVGDRGDWYRITKRRFSSPDLALAWGQWFLEHQMLISSTDEA